MNRLKAWVRAFFGLSRRETQGFIILLPLLILSVFIMPTYHLWKASQKQDFSKESKELDSLLARWTWEEKKDSILKEADHVLFTFNPNTSTKEDLIRLGFSNQLATRIHNYRTKKGRFLIKSDLLKIYGMDSGLYKRVFAFINLPEERETKKSALPAINETAVSLPKEKFDINQADTTQLISIYGIGSKLSQRIIKYKNQLGGFISMNQLSEVYGLDTAVINELNRKAYITSDYQPKKININSVTEKELSTHPYIKYSLAKAITTYRFQHGNFNSVEDLKKIALIDETFYNKIKPYLTLNP
ncbi:MAG TPA: helix-hairpin-helix domain-containing protein [Cyclobacteriaceae bacterium]|nr:helix-hairpin-helix domain-containing protein [Cyclobacteriaceae bacterium]